LGVLDVQQDVRGGLTQADAELLQSIANQVAIGLRNAELYEYAQQSAEREAVVNVINQRIQQAASLDVVLQTAAEEIGRALGARETTIQLDASVAAAEQAPGAKNGGARNDSTGKGSGTTVRPGPSGGAS
jgi:hypothetical protein